MLRAGAAKIDITPAKSVWMDGMIRSHPSEGVHDALHARALYLSTGAEPRNAFILLSADVCVLSAEDATGVRRRVEATSGISADRIVLAATHTHSGPATLGFFNPSESEYREELVAKLESVTAQAVADARPAAVGCGRGREDTISHYRRLLAKDGHVVMNWETYPSDEIVGPLGEIDPELLVVRVVEAGDRDRCVCTLFNHAGHPNVLSGDNYLISSDYPGRAAELVERELGGVALFLNGAQGTMDIDGLKDRDWEGRERAGSALAGAVIHASESIPVSPSVSLRGSSRRYTIPVRRISDPDYRWALRVLEQTGGGVRALPDGVGEDYTALLYKRIRERGKDAEVEQVCVAIDDCALISFPGELFTEIGSRIKSESPFVGTGIVGLANGYIGYVPTRAAIRQGGYEPSIREVDDVAEDLVVEESLALLRAVIKGRGWPIHDGPDEEHR